MVLFTIILLFQITIMQIYYYYFLEIKFHRQINFWNLVVCSELIILIIIIIIIYFLLNFIIVFISDFVLNLKAHPKAHIYLILISHSKIVIFNFTLNFIY
jgi:hypothetical protein